MKKLFFAVLFAAAASTALAQRIALPPGTVEGRLPNGMHYIIKPNPIPRHTVEFRLALRVGSLRENDRQRGCAHFLEHMATNGMKMFPGRSVIDYFERQGMKYGRDINAFTGFDRTIYWFTFPASGNADHAIDTTLMVVRGILSDLTFNEERTRRERGVIVEELRGYDTGDPFYDLKIGDGRYRQRMPLGSESDIMSVDRQTLVGFYRQWYTPQAATLVVVGDVDAPQMERLIRQHLESLPRRASATAGNYSLDYRPGIRMMELRDSLNSSSRIELIIPHLSRPVRSIEDMTEKSRDEIFVQAVAGRLGDAGIPCMVSDKWYLADQNHFVLSFSGERKDSLLSYVTRSAAVIEYLASEGPTPEELASLRTMKSQRLFCDSAMSLSSKWCDDFVDYAITGDLAICSQQELQAVSHGVLQTEAEDIRTRARDLLKAAGQHLLVAYSNHQGAGESLTESAIGKAWAQGKAADAPPFVARRPAEKKRQPAIPGFLTARHDYQPSAIVSEKTYQEMGLHEVMLKNGVRLLLRPTLDEEKRLQLTALGRGGSSDLDDNDYYRLKDAVGYMDMGGIEGIEDSELGEIMGQQNISMNIGLENHWHQLMATADAEDAQLMMNLVYEKMHHPRKNYCDFEESLQSEADSWGQETLLSRLMRRDPDRVMNNCVDSIVGNVLTRRDMRKDDLEKMNLDDMAAYYQRLFTNPHDLTIILTGNYDLQEIKTAAIGTFARMQRPDSVLPVRDDPVQPVRSYVRKFDGENPSQTVFNYIFAGNYYPSLKTTLTFKLMRDLLQQRLLQVLRERENIVYSPYSDLAYHGLPQRVYYFWLTIAVKNENARRAQQALREIVTGLQENLVSTGELDKMKRSFVVTKYQQLNDMAPAEWKEVVCTLIRNGESADSFNNYDEILSQITPESIREAFRNYIDIDNCILMYKAK